MDKYYTPTIEEFHQGFIYEWNYKEEGWKLDTFDINSGDTDCIAGDFYEFSPSCPQTKCRVKYLDKEDIESLGWKLISEEIKELYKSNFCTFKKDKNELHIQLEKVNDSYPNKLTIRGDYLNINILIKNKSELIKLMQQLGIK